MKSFAIYTHPSKPKAIEYAKKAAQILNNMGADILATEQFCDEVSSEKLNMLSQCEERDFEKKADILLSFGGDGTMLQASKLMLDASIPIAGFNVGRLGFLAEYTLDKLESSINDLVEGNYRIVERTVLEAEFKDKKMYALNDLVMEKKNTSRMINIRTWSNANHVADYRADGLIITTPTGSTAYSLSCGGPIIAPGTPVICLTPISPHTLTLRPLVIPDQSEIKMVVESPTGETNFVVDGHEVAVVNDGEEVRIRKSEHIVKLIKPTESSYYDLLREKFLWASHLGMRV